MTPEGHLQTFWKPFALLALLAAGELCAAPTITTHPTTPLVGLGMPSLTLNVAANGNGTLSYQWLRNGAVIPGASQASLTLAPVDHTTRGVYQVRVTDDDGTTLSRMTRVGHAAGDLILWGGSSGSDGGGALLEWQKALASATQWVQMLEWLEDGSTPWLEKTVRFVATIKFCRLSAQAAETGWASQPDSSPAWRWTRRDTRPSVSRWMGR